MGGIHKKEGKETKREAKAPSPSPQARVSIPLPEKLLTIAIASALKSFTFEICGKEDLLVD
ncbi:hypothetical protein SDJN02_24320, partial [Cucurbita argyrosperma subsp. argyrosperma]